MGRGHINKTEATVKKCLEAEAVTKSGDELKVQTSGEIVGYSKVGTKHSNKVINKDFLGVKAPKQLVTRQPRKGVTNAGGAALSRRES